MDLPENTIGFESSEDCAVIPIDEKSYLIQSVDFFTPIVDDPFTFGQIAASNSLSDIYAMGGTPTYALNIAEFPSDILDLEILHQILKGGMSIAKEAGIPILGGHTIKDPIPKYGLSVTGKVKKELLTLNSNAKEGDVLILTKPIGLGIISTAIKKDAVNQSIINNAIKTMVDLNKNAAEAMNAIGVNACTDITGYGLLGHLLEMCKASNVSANIKYKKIPIIPGVEKLIEKGFIPGGTKKNLDHAAKTIKKSQKISLNNLYLLADAQTSGGLLISIKSEKAHQLQKLLDNSGVLSSSIIGNISAKQDFIINID
jgi:selenide,water dikinase